MDLPRRFSDLSWSAERATEWASRAAALWSGLLEALPFKPVARAWADGEVRKGVALDKRAAVEPRVLGAEGLALGTGAGAPPSLGVCCFRYVPPELELTGAERETYLDELNARLMTDVQLDGRAYCSNAVLGQRFVLRACIVNFRTEAEDVDALIDAVCELGARAHRKLNG